eukprot:PhF_6_TR43003/c0_g1_i5/m.65677
MVIKGSSTTPQELYAYIVARAAGIHVPETRLLQWPSPTYSYVQGAIRTTAAKDEIAKRRVTRMITRSYFLLQEYLPQAHVMDVHQAPLTWEMAQYLGQIVALDVVLNNYDRIPCGTVWSNNGNYNNIILNADGSVIMAIDNCITPLLGAEAIANHTASLNDVLQNIDSYAQQVYDKLTTAAGFQLQSDWKPIANGMRSTFRTLSSLASDDAFLKIKKGLTKILRTDWENVWKDACNSIHDAYLNAITQVLVTFEKGTPEHTYYVPWDTCIQGLDFILPK